MLIIDIHKLTLTYLVIEYCRQVYTHSMYRSSWMPLHNLKRLSGTRNTQEQSTHPKK